MKKIVAPYKKETLLDRDRRGLSEAVKVTLVTCGKVAGTRRIDA
jgi:hypothetical protein